jgi:hypothetical protein
VAWDEMDEKYGRKVGYWTSFVRDGVTVPYETTAYLHAETEPDTFTGTNKHSDEPVTVRWVEERERYEEVT